MAGGDMGRSRPYDPSPAVTAQRAARLYRLLSLTADKSQTRTALLRKLRVDLRGFYRDLELLRSLGIGVPSEGDRYQLLGTLDEALSLLPFPDPGLSLREALMLCNGRTDAHRKLRSRVNTFIGSNGRVGTTQEA
jgi:predicted DNA-binding transcriptional regulator YafY